MLGDSPYARSTGFYHLFLIALAFDVFRTYQLALFIPVRISDRKVELILFLQMEGTIEVDGETSQVEIVSVEPPTYAEEVDLVTSMGFGDVERIQDLLRDNRGDVNRVVDTLLMQFEFVPGNIPSTQG